MTGYSQTPLVNKLGFKPGFRVCVIDPISDYYDVLTGLPENVAWLNLADGNLDLVHIFATKMLQLEGYLLKAKQSIKSNGAIWVSWPKQTSTIHTELDENMIRNFALENGLVDVKVCAIDENWSGLKLVIRLKDR